MPYKHSKFRARVDAVAATEIARVITVNFQGGYLTDYGFLERKEGSHDKMAEAFRQMFGFPDDKQEEASDLCSLLQNFVIGAGPDLWKPHIPARVRFFEFQGRKFFFRAGRLANGAVAAGFWEMPQECRLSAMEELLSPALSINGPRDYFGPESSWHLPKNFSVNVPVLREGVAGLSLHGGISRCDGTGRDIQMVPSSFGESPRDEAAPDYDSLCRGLRSQFPLGKAEAINHQLGGDYAGNNPCEDKTVVVLSAYHLPSAADFSRKSYEDTIYHDQGAFSVGAFFRLEPGYGEGKKDARAIVPPSQLVPRDADGKVSPSDLTAEMLAHLVRVTMYGRPHGRGVTAAFTGDPGKSKPVALPASLFDFLEPKPQTPEPSVGTLNDFRPG